MFGYNKCAFVHTVVTVHGDRRQETLSKAIYIQWMNLFTNIDLCVFHPCNFRRLYLVPRDGRIFSPTNMNTHFQIANHKCGHFAESFILYVHQPWYHSHDGVGSRYFKMCGANWVFFILSHEERYVFSMLWWRSNLWISMKMIRYSNFIFFILYRWNEIALWTNSILLIFMCVLREMIFFIKYFWRRLIFDLFFSHWMGQVRFLCRIYALCRCQLTLFSPTMSSLFYQIQNNHSRK